MGGPAAVRDLEAEAAGDFGYLGQGRDMHIQMALVFWEEVRGELPRILETGDFGRWSERPRGTVADRWSHLNWS